MRAAARGVDVYDIDTKTTRAGVWFWSRYATGYGTGCALFQHHYPVAEFVHAIEAFDEQIALPVNSIDHLISACLALRERDAAHAALQ